VDVSGVLGGERRFLTGTELRAFCRRCEQCVTGHTHLCHSERSRGTERPENVPVARFQRGGVDACGHPRQSSSASALDRTNWLLRSQRFLDFAALRSE
jgi:hypothetical protein